MRQEKYEIESMQRTPFVSRIARVFQDRDVNWTGSIGSNWPDAVCILLKPQQEGTGVHDCALFRSSIGSEYILRARQIRILNAKLSHDGHAYRQRTRLDRSIIIGKLRERIKVLQVPGNDPMYLRNTLLNATLNLQKDEKRVHFKEKFFACNFLLVNCCFFYTKIFNRVCMSFLLIFEFFRQIFGIL